MTKNNMNFDWAKCMSVEDVEVPVEEYDDGSDEYDEYDESDEDDEYGGYGKSFSLLRGRIRQARGMMRELNYFFEEEQGNSEEENWHLSARWSGGRIEPCQTRYELCWSY
ncbi:hypothetical protein CJU90_3610 [Yarrowia sp. C11]|nr:hypothetical protein CJU90_3610 [Yarrowia sp. C11]